MTLALQPSLLYHNALMVGSDCSTLLPGAESDDPWELLTLVSPKVSGYSLHTLTVRGLTRAIKHDWTE